MPCVAIELDWKGVVTAKCSAGKGFCRWEGRGWQAFHAQGWRHSLCRRQETEDLLKEQQMAYKKGLWWNLTIALSPCIIACEIIIIPGLTFWWLEEGSWAPQRLTGWRGKQAENWRQADNWANNGLDQWGQIPLTAPTSFCLLTNSFKSRNVQLFPTCRSVWWSQTHLTAPLPQLSLLEGLGWFVNAGIVSIV